MQQYQNVEISKIEAQSSSNKPSNLIIDVSKRYQQKQIDTRWIELKMSNNKLSSRSYFASCIQAGKVFIHGGYNQQKGILNDLFQAQFYNLPSQWIEIKPKPSTIKDKNPPALRNHTLCAYMSNLILFGGQKNMLENNNKFYKFDMRINQWFCLSIKFLNDKKFPIALDSHVAKIYNDNMFIFGGYQSQKGVYSNSLIQVNLKNINNNQITIQRIEPQVKNNCPSPRGNLASCMIDNQMYIFGGTNSDQIFDDLWCNNFDTNQWKEIEKPKGNKEKQNSESWVCQWPQKRKGHTMVTHLPSRSIFMFGGIKEITKQQNDIMIYLIAKKKWIRIHKSTNELYEPSPTIKKQLQNSPTIIEAKNKKSNSKNKNGPTKKQSPFKIDIKSVTVYAGSNNSGSKINNTTSFGNNNKNVASQKIVADHHYQSTTNSNKFINVHNANHLKSVKTQYGHGFSSSTNIMNITSFNNESQSPTSMISKKHMSVVQQKKLRQFMNRKKKLLNQVNKHNIDHPTTTKRPHSPTSQTIIYSIDSIGQQKKYSQNFHEQLPKVIFDQQKGALIGKKPCARDGHCGLVYENNIIIIGGDRHMISFNDVYLFKMDKAIQNIHLYEDRQ